MTTEDPIADLVDRWEVLFDGGYDSPVEELCKDRPQLAQTVARRIARLKDFKQGDLCSAAEQKTPFGTAKQAEPVIYGPLKPGDTPVPLFRLLEPLASGGFGVVWRAEYLLTLRPCAIKFICDDKKLLIEYEGLKLIKDVSHPLILHRHGCHRTQAGLILITEVAEATLEKRFREHRDGRGMRPETLCAEALYFLRDAAEALDHLHTKAEIAHLDVKPANLLLTAYGRCKVADFGTVRPMRSSCSGSQDVVVLSAPVGNGGDVVTVNYRNRNEVRCARLFASGTTLFTHAGAISPRYASPEAYVGKASRSSDQYSLALTFCELVTGTIPFAGESGQQQRMRSEGIMDLTHLLPALREPMARALSPWPTDRFPSCLEFVEAIKTALLPVVVGRNRDAWTRLVEWPDRPHGVALELPTNEEAIAQLESLASPDAPPALSAQRPKERITLTTVLVVSLVPFLLYWAWVNSLARRLARLAWWITFQGRLLLFVLLTLLSIWPAALLVEQLSRLAPLLKRPLNSAKNESSPGPHPDPPAGGLVPRWPTP